MNQGDGFGECTIDFIMNDRFPAIPEATRKGSVQKTIKIQ
jgi:hypothetical protein